MIKEIYQENEIFITTYIVPLEELESPTVLANGRIEKVNFLVEEDVVDNNEVDKDEVENRDEDDEEYEDDEENEFPFSDDD